MHSPFNNHCYFYLKMQIQLIDSLYRNIEYKYRILILIILKHVIIKYHGIIPITDYPAISTVHFYKGWTTVRLCEYGEIRTKTVCVFDGGLSLSHGLMISPLKP